MAKKGKVSQFVFSRHDYIGAAAAEEDEEFLRSCFVDTGDLAVLEDPDDKRVVVLGRTGSGKSALLRELARRKGRAVIPLKPENLALSYISNSTILQFFAAAGVNLDPFFKLLWRHVLTVEVLSHHLSSQDQKSERRFPDLLRALFPGSTVMEKKAREAIDYLTKWGETFWQETEYRVREITEKVEKELEAAAEGKIPIPIVDLAASGSLAGRLSKEERRELISRGQEIVSRAQVQDLSKVLDLLQAVLEDRQQVYYIAIDQLDENWVEERLRYKLIMALILTAREFLQVNSAKVILALRRDLIERVFRLTRESGFQEEKYHSLYLPLEWAQPELLGVLDRRVSTLTERRYTSEPVGYRDLLPARVSKKRLDDFLFERAQRPRDIIALFNACIQAAQGKAKVNVQLLKHAEGEWSRSRFRALADEWGGDYPRLLDFAALLQGRAPSFKVETISDAEIEEFCLERAAEEPEGRGLLQSIALNLVDMLVSAEDARRQILKVFYRVGLVGLKLAPHEAESWVDQLGRGVSTAEIGPSTSVVAHPAFWRALGIRPT